MSMKTAVAPQPVVPADVLAFAEEQGVAPLLQPLIEHTRQVYPTATRFEVFLEDDPEFPDRYIVLELDVPLSLSQAREADRQWHEGFQNIYPYPRTGVFRLSADLRP